MDLWDLTKLLFRRWYVTAPMLLLSGIMVVLVAKSVGPDYSAKGHLQIIPAPSVGKEEPENAKPRPANPWLDLGYDALANAAALAVTDLAVLEDLANRGFSDSVTVTMDDNTVLLEIEAIGTTKAQATATVKEVIKLIEKEIAARQQQYGVMPEDTITTLTLNDGSTPEVVRSKVMRVLVVAAGIGVLLTVGGTIALDVFLQRRARRREAQVARVVPQVVPQRDADRPAGGINGHSKAVIVEPIAVRSRPAASAVDDEPTGVLPRMPGVTDVKDKPTVKAVEYKSANGSADAKAGDDVGEFPPLSADATIVLPLSHVSWRTDKKT